MQHQRQMRAGDGEGHASNGRTERHSEVVRGAGWWSPSLKTALGSGFEPPSPPAVGTFHKQWSRGLSLSPLPLLLL